MMGLVFVVEVIPVVVGNLDIEYQMRLVAALEQLGFDTNVDMELFIADIAEGSSTGGSIA